MNADEFKIAINPVKKQHVAYLFSTLNSEPNRMIEPVGGRGYLSYIESKIVDYSNIPLGKDYLNKTASKIRTEPSKFSEITKEVNQIIEKIKV